MTDNTISDAVTMQGGAESRAPSPHTPPPLPGTSPVSAGEELRGSPPNSVVDVNCLKKCGFDICELFENVYVWCSRTV